MMTAWVRHAEVVTLGSYVYVMTATSRRKAKVIGSKPGWLLILIPETPSHSHP